ncbi:MAG: hypothetical protein ACI93H_000222 [Psychromonas sp.]|jgi:hypothetical protein
MASVIRVPATVITPSVLHYFRKLAFDIKITNYLYAIGAMNCS